jgi:methionine sulfoxide reductase heme-binding subunit
MTPAWFARHMGRIKMGVFAACSLPGVWLLWASWQDQLGANPLATLTAVSGTSAMLALIVTLTVTPSRRVLTLLFRQFDVRFGRRMADWNWLVRLRRMLGLWAFAYACLHAAVYLEFDVGWALDVIGPELQQKPYLLVGAAAWLILAVLAITSAKRLVRLLGKNWLRLHRTVYLTAGLVVLHHWWLVKPGDWSPLPYTLCFVALLSYRVLVKVGLMERWDGCDGLESSTTHRIPPPVSMPPLQNGHSPS